MREVAIVGIGGTRFGKYPDVSIRALGEEACLDALRDAGMKPREIQLAYAGNLAQWEWGQGLLIGHSVLRELGITKIRVVDTTVDDGIIIKCLKKDPTKNEEEALKDIYRRLRPGDPPTAAGTHLGALAGDQPAREVEGVAVGASAVLAVHLNHSVGSKAQDPVGRDV